MPAQVAEVTAGPWELVRALGAVILTPPPANGRLCAALDLPQQTAVDHTSAFVLGLPAHAAIYLGPEGKLGGDSQDRVDGFWRALGMRAPEDADHLGALLMLYAELGDAADRADEEQVHAGLTAARTALFDEHIWSWAPAYLAALPALEIDSVTAWAELAAEVIGHERATLPSSERLPLALREAPLGLVPDAGVDEVLDVLVAPVRSGVFVSQRDLQRCASALGIGLRRGERRYALKALLSQDPAATLAWFADFARAWSRRHAALGDDACSQWWAQRAAGSAGALQVTIGEPSPAR